LYVIQYLEISNNRHFIYAGGLALIKNKKKRCEKR